MFSNTPASIRTHSPLWAGAWLAPLLFALPSPAAAQPVLFDFDQELDLTKIPARDVQLSLVKQEKGSALRLAFGHKQAWPGLDLAAPKGNWDLAKFAYLELNVKNVGDTEATLCCRVDNQGADGVQNCNTGRIALKPGETGTLRVDFSRKPASDPGIKLFGMRGYPFSQQTERTIDPAKVNQLVVFAPQPKEDCAFEIDNLRAGGSDVPPPADTSTPGEFFPFIDTFGQYIHRDWPGKTHSVEELQRNLAGEQTDLAAHPGPADWDQYGGWKNGPTLDATGFFRTAKHEGKWWLVDPEGKLFFSHGIDCVRSGDSTPIDDRQNWFQDFPGDQPGFAEFLGKQGNVVRDYYQGKQPKTFNFLGANLKRKLGDDWKQRYAELAHQRLRSWGLNTIANWSDEAVYLRSDSRSRRTPYVVSIHFGGKVLEGSTGYWGQFRDVFDPDFERQLRSRLQQEVGKSAGDPWCIGYFVDNELSWGNEISLAVAALVSPPEQAAKRAFVDDLKAKYGAIDKLNEAWGEQHPSWDALLQHRKAPSEQKALPDLLAFYARTADSYFSIIRKAVKEVAPNQLYLGCRFAWVNKTAAEAAAKYCDVVSFNLYRRTVANFTPPFEADLPLIIGEFHFGALDRGMFHTGLVKVKDQAERAQVHKEYVEGCLRHPQFVGCHWFKYQDEPTTGRGLDGENYQIGFVDTCDTPYPETIEACREVGYGVYGRP